MIQAWNRFWFAPAPTHLLSLVRVFTGVWILMKRVGLSGLYRLPDWKVSFTRHAVKSERDYHLIGFRDPMPGFEWLPVPSVELYQAMEGGLTVLGVMMIVGLFTRPVVATIAAYYVWLHLVSRFPYVHHNAVFGVTFVVLALSHCGDHYSVDALFRRAPAPERPIYPLRMLQIFVSTLYGSTTLGKLNEGWFDGRMMELLYENGHMKGALYEWVYTHVGPRLLGHFTLFAEGFVSLGLWIPQLRLPAILSGVALHAGIDSVMAVTTFSYQITSLYVVFLDPRPHRTVVRGARGLRWLDWLCRARWEPGERFEVVAPGGQAYRGLRAAVEIGLRMPMTFPLAMGLGLPFTLWGKRRSA